MERLLVVKVTVFVETNKGTYERQCRLAEDESMEEFAGRVKAIIEETTDVNG